MRRIVSLRALRALIREDWERHNREVLSPGFQALAVYRFGVWAREREPGIGRSILWRLHRLLFFVALNLYGIELHPGTRIGRRVFLPHRGGIVIHPAAVIGDDVTIRQNVTIGAKGHRIPGAPRIGDRVEIGAGAVLFGNIEIGHDVLIGPNVVVGTDVPPFRSLQPAVPTMRTRSGAATPLGAAAEALAAVAPQDAGLTIAPVAGAAPAGPAPPA